MIQSRRKPLLLALSFLCLPILNGCTDLRSFELDNPTPVEEAHPVADSHAEPGHPVPAEEAHSAEEAHTGVLAAESVTNTLVIEWTERYKPYTEAITSRNLKAWSAFIAPSFEWTKPDGTKAKRDAAIVEFGEIFKAKSITGTEEVLDVTEAGGLVHVKLHIDLVMNEGEPDEFNYVSNCTDVWKLINGKWLMVKSIDEPTPTEQANKPTVKPAEASTGH